MGLAPVVLAACVAVVLIIGFCLGMITQWCRRPQTNRICLWFKRRLSAKELGFQPEISNGWTSQGPGPLQHAFSLQVDAVESELFTQANIGGSAEIPEAPTMASGIVDVEKPRAPLRRLLSVPSTPGNDRTPIAREIQAAIPNTEIGTDEIHLVEIVGKGAFGTVYRGTWRGAPVAVKRTTLNMDDAGALQQSQWEAVLSEHLRHPNVVQTFAWTVHAGVQLEEEATADELSFVEQALSQTRLAEVLQSAGTMAPEAAKKEEAPGVSNSAAPSGESGMDSGGLKIMKQQSGAHVVIDIPASAVASDMQPGQGKHILAAGTIPHPTGAIPAYYPQGRTSAILPVELPTVSRCFKDADGASLEPPSGTTERFSWGMRDRPTLLDMSRNAARATSAFAGSQGPSYHSMVANAAQLQRMPSNAGSLASMPSGAFTLSGAMSDASAFFASVSRQSGPPSPTADMRQQGGMPEVGPGLVADWAQSMGGGARINGDTTNPTPSGCGALGQTEMVDPAGRTAEVREWGGTAVRTSAKLPIKRRLDFETPSGAGLTVASVEIPDLALAANGHEAGGHTIAAPLCAQTVIRTCSEGLPTCEPPQQDPLDRSCSMSEPAPFVDSAQRRPSSPELDLEDGPISSTSSVQSGSDTLSAHSASLPWIRTGRPSRRVDQARALTLGGKVSHGRPCPPLQACSFLQTPGQGEGAHAALRPRPESPEYAQSPCGDTLMPLHSVSTGTQHQDRRGRGQSADGSEVSFNSDEGFGSPHLTCRKRSSAAILGMVDSPAEASKAVVVVVMEYCDLGSLLRAIRRKTFKPHGQWGPQITYRALLRTAQEIAKGMEYIHSRGIIHGDLKPGNVLLKTHRIDRRGYIAKVSDFGLSVHPAMQRVAGEGKELLGTIAYTAPEVLQDASQLQMPSDVYAFGLLMWEMYNCQTLYEGLVEAQIYHGVSEGTLRPVWDDAVPSGFRDLATSCWDQNPENRPSFGEIVHCLTTIEVEYRKECYRNRPKSLAATRSIPRRNSLQLHPSPLAPPHHGSALVEGMQ